MRVLFIANHDKPDADDEGAVTHALLENGCEVVRVQERRGKQACKVAADWALFFKWSDTEALQKLTVPRVFWFFDLVAYSDSTLRHRCAAREKWMTDTLPHVSLGFCTDGDFAARHPDKLVWLPQGADGRVAGRGVPEAAVTPILFTGIGKRGGVKRESFVQEMSRTYGSMFRHVTHGVYGRALADLIASAQIVVAPDGPVTDRYWSNRVYVTLGYGGFLLHPYCERLSSQYEDGKEIVFYRGREDLHRKVRYYLERPKERAAIAEAGLAKTLAAHTYAHRIRELVRVVRERVSL